MHFLDPAFCSTVFGGVCYAADVVTFFDSIWRALLGHVVGHGVLRRSAVNVKPEEECKKRDQNKFICVV